MESCRKVAVITGAASGIGRRSRRIGAPQRARDGARRHGREHRRGRSEESTRRRVGRSRTLSRRYDRRGVSRVRSSTPSAASTTRSRCACRPRASPATISRSHRQGLRQGADLSGRPLQAGPRCQPRRAGLLGARDDRTDRREPRGAAASSDGSRRGNAGRHRVHRLRLVAGQPRPDFVRQHQGRPRRCRGDDHEGGGLLTACAAELIHPGFTDTPMVARWRRRHQQPHPPFTQMAAWSARGGRRRHLLHAGQLGGQWRTVRRGLVCTGVGGPARLKSAPAKTSPPRTHPGASPSRGTRATSQRSASSHLVLRFQVRKSGDCRDGELIGPPTCT